MTSTLALRPATEADLPCMWQWLREFPSANFDDYGPQDENGFNEQMLQRLKVERIMVAEFCGAPVGFMAFLPLTDRMGTLHGICFSRHIHGTRFAHSAMLDFLTGLLDSGIEKICAGYFADNERVRRFLAKLGFKDEGLLRKHTVRNGIPIDMRTTALHKETS